MMKNVPRIRAKVWLSIAAETVIADVVNPGEWFGKTIVVQIAIANALNPFLVIEADNEQDAIDVWADSDTYGHLINDEETDPNDEDACVAGNDSHCVNLDNVAFCKATKVEYFVEIPDHTDWSLVASLQEVIDNWHNDNDAAMD
jgi:hypothetical protein